MKAIFYVAALILLALVGSFLLADQLNDTGKKDDDLKTHLTPLKDNHHLLQGTKPRDTKCFCARHGDTVWKTENGKRVLYDEGFCGQCIGGIIYGCPSSECGGECEKLLFSGPTCNECNGSERNPFCTQTVKNVTEAPTE